MTPEGFIVSDKTGTHGSTGERKEYPAFTKAGAVKYVEYMNQEYANREFEIKPLGDVPFVADWNPSKETH